MTGQMPEHDSEFGRTYDDGGGPITAILGAVLMCAAIVGLFLFITWFAHATS